MANRFSLNQLTVITGVAALFFLAAPARSQEAAKTPEVKKAPEYVGSETCQTCHEDIYKAFQKNKHAIVETDKKRGWATKACESCHGPGSAHAESASAADIRNPAKIAPQETDRTCLKCHLNQPTHVGRIQGGHARNQVSCVSCHSIHSNVAGPPHTAGMSLTATRAERINNQCTACHVSTWAQFQRPYTHRLPQGTMSCIDCHNPHGSLLPKSIRTANENEPGCFSCHGDKRGPFTFEHPVMRLDGCTACHEPHGSANPKMLVRTQERFLCLECHANLSVGTVANTGALGGVPPAFHDLRSSRFRNCSVCHIKVHGSNVDRVFLR